MAELTGATFTGDVSGNRVFSNASAALVQAYSSSGTGTATLRAYSGSNYWDWEVGSTSLLEFKYNGTQKVSISNTGEATFSGALTGTSANFSSTYGAGSTNDFLTVSRSGGAVAATLGYDSPNTEMYFGTSTAQGLQIRTGGVTRIHIPASGSAIDFYNPINGTSAAFSSSISALGGTFTRPVYSYTGSGSYATSLGGSGGDYGSVGYNVGYTTTTSSYTYVTTDYSSFLRFDAGGFSFFGAASGTSGATMSPTRKMLLTNNGNLTIGSTDGSGSGNLFANDISTNGIIYAYKAASDVVLEGGQIYMSGGYTSFRRAVDNSLNIDNYNGGTRITALKIAQSGASTFFSTLKQGTGSTFKFGTISASGVLTSSGDSYNIPIDIDGVTYYLRLFTATN